MDLLRLNSNRVLGNSADVCRWVTGDVDVLDSDSRCCGPDPLSGSHLLPEHTHAHASDGDTSCTTSVSVQAKVKRGPGPQARRARFRFRFRLSARPSPAPDSPSTFLSCTFFVCEWGVIGFL